jgi:hypothetical protein
MSIIIFKNVQICLIVLAPDVMTKIGNKAAQDFVCAVSKVVDRVKTVALYMVRKKKIYIYKGP